MYRNERNQKPDANGQSTPKPATVIARKQSHTLRQPDLPNMKIRLGIALS